MARSHRNVIDEEAGWWLAREALEIDPEDPPAPQDDYAALMAVPLVWGDHTGSGSPVFWGRG